jgi:hypothetical protein
VCNIGNKINSDEKNKMLNIPITQSFVLKLYFNLDLATALVELAISPDLHKFRPPKRKLKY